MQRGPPSRSPRIMPYRTGAHNRGPRVRIAEPVGSTLLGIKPENKDGAAERTRTSTPLRELAPEASASTNSATAAWLDILVCSVRLPGPFARPVCPARSLGIVVRLRGLEPPRGLPHSALNAARLPIPPQPPRRTGLGSVGTAAGFIARAGVRAIEICLCGRFCAAKPLAAGRSTVMLFPGAHGEITTIRPGGAPGRMARWDAGPT